MASVVCGCRGKPSSVPTLHQTVLNREPVCRNPIAFFAHATIRQLEPRMDANQEPLILLRVTTGRRVESALADGIKRMKGPAPCESRALHRPWQIDCQAAR